MPIVALWYCSNALHKVMCMFAIKRFLDEKALNTWWFEWMKYPTSKQNVFPISSACAHDMGIIDLNEWNVQHPKKKKFSYFLRMCIWYGYQWFEWMKYPTSKKENVFLFPLHVHMIWVSMIWMNEISNIQKKCFLISSACAYDMGIDDLNEWNIQHPKRVFFWFPSHVKMTWVMMIWMMKYPTSKKGVFLFPSHVNMIRVSMIWMNEISNIQKGVFLVSFTCEYDIGNDNLNEWTIQHPKRVFFLVSFTCEYDMGNDDWMNEWNIQHPKKT